jgi:alpha-L-fucosidase
VDISQQNLRAAGVWIKSHAEAIFNTTYWSITPEEGDTVRFTQTPDAFYISTLYAPNDTLVLTSPVPYVEGDEVTVVGGNASGTVVPSELSDGKLTLTISEDVRNSDEYAWVFKIAYGGTNNSGAGAGSIGGRANGSGDGEGSGNGADSLRGSSIWKLAVSLGMMLFLL